MKLVSVLTASTLLVLVACSSDSTTTTPPAGGTTSSSGDNGGLEGDGVGAAASAPDKNLAGDAYPTANIGQQPGSVIKNYKFVGYPDAAVGAGLKPVSLAQFFDPTGEKYKLIHIQAAGSWCAACKGETTALVPIAKDLEAKKVVWIVSLAEGPKGGDPSTKTDLDNWIKEFDSPFTHVLDPNNKNLGVFYDRSALPWNADIDATTMKIITAKTGGAQTSDRIMEEIDAALAKVK